MCINEQLWVTPYLTLGILEIQVIFAVLKELAGGDVHPDEDLALVAGLLDGLHQQLQRLAVVLEVGGEAALVTDSGSVKAVLLLDQGLEDEDEGRRGSR